MTKYKIIYQDLARKIKQHDYQAGTLLPSESRLQIQYHASRDTIRKALTLLKENGFIQKKKGKGSIVVDAHEFSLPIAGISSFAELNKQNHLLTQTRVLTMKDLTVTDQIFDNRAATDRSYAVIYIERLRFINHEPVIIDKNYILKDIVPEVPVNAAQSSLYRYFEDKLKLNIGYAEKIITVEEANEQDQKLLNLSPAKTIVDIHSKTFLDDARVLQFSESRHRSDRFRFFDFERRTHGGMIENYIKDD
ncbi:MAG: trehalose operon repressor [Sporolactobacillus sp.]|jgi:GntR family trehalose operon transcriptional repressor|nr:trehalose operon repressor [Sporolactobacillus sp.]